MFSNFKTTSLGGSVLIDTWWNVNKLIHTVQCTCDLVLIDTWWNVNFWISGTCPVSVFVLIDTWWNVNNNAYLFLLDAVRF